MTEMSGSALHDIATSAHIHPTACHIASSVACRTIARCGPSWRSAILPFQRVKRKKYNFHYEKTVLHVRMSLTCYWAGPQREALQPCGAGSQDNPHQQRGRRTCSASNRCVTLCFVDGSPQPAPSWSCGPEPI